MMTAMLFNNRIDAGRQLARALERRGSEASVILALARGGVPVAAEIARIMGAVADIFVVRKVGAPFQPELAMAAVAEGVPPHVELNPPVLRSLGLDPDDIAEDVARETDEVAKRVALYRGGRSRLPVTGRDVIIVDDGIATGCTIRAAIAAVRREQPRSIGVAVPVAPPDELPAIERLADWVVCLSAPEPFGAVAAHYRTFPQLTDDEVITRVKAWRKMTPMSDPRDLTPPH